MNQKMSKTLPSNTAVFANRYRLGRACNRAVIASLMMGGASIASAEAAPSFAIEEIVVTAQKRAQNVQDVPISITALSEQALEKRGIDNPQDLQSFVPGLTFGETVQGKPQLTLRGVGTENATIGGDPGVALHIDGHYIQEPSYLTRDFFDLARVEVLRGPQGTLYGRNSIGGTINIITNKPTDEFEAKVGAMAGNYGARRINGFVSGPLIDNVLLGRLAVVDDERDGYIENVSPLASHDVDDSDYTSVRTSLLYTPSDVLEVYLKSYYYEDDSSTAYFLFPNPFPTAPNFVNGSPNFWLNLGLVGTNISAQDPRKISQNAPNDASAQASGASIDISWDLGDYIFKSLSSYDNSEKNTLTDFDGTDASSLDQTLNSETRTFSQELQLSSNSADDSLRWIAGLYYFTEDARFYLANDFTEIYGPNLVTFGFGEVDTTSFGAFGQMDIPVGDQTNITVGLRYTKDEKDFVDFFLFGIPLIDGAVSDEWEKVTGRLGIQHHLSDDVMLFASLSNGFKAGGTAIATLPYDPETVDSLEFGVKSTLLDSQLQLNVSGFYNDYKDRQEFRFSLQSISPVIENAAGVTVYGIDIESIYIPVENLQINTMLSYQRGRYDEFDTRDQTNPAAGLQDLSGNSLARTPEWKFSVGAQYEWSLGNVGSLLARIDYSWVDEQWFRPQNRDIDRASPYHKTNARLSWASVDESWQVSAFVDNIENDDIANNQSQSSGFLGHEYVATYQPPRTYGVKFEYTFQ